MGNELYEATLELLEKTIGKPVMAEVWRQIYPFETLALRPAYEADRAVLLISRRPNWRRQFSLYFARFSPNSWYKLSVKDIDMDESWQEEPLRYSEMNAILRLAKEHLQPITGVIGYSDEKYYYLGGLAEVLNLTAEL